MYKNILVFALIGMSHTQSLGMPKNQHEKIGYICKICKADGREVIYPTSGGLYAHNKKTHKTRTTGIAGYRVMLSENEEFYCRPCQLLFKNQEAFSYHILIHKKQLRSK